MDSVTVVGGSGFIGSRLCRLLAEEFELRLLDKTPSDAYPEKWRQADVCDRKSLAEGILPRSVVINLAAEHRDDVRPVSLYDVVNVTGAANCCAAASSNGVEKIVFTSSVAVYGFSREPISEDAPLRPFNDYGRTKREAEEVYMNWQSEKPEERTLVIIRPTVVFGEGNRGNVYNLIRQIKSGLFFMIGEGKNKKSMAYVENVASFIKWTLSLGPGVHVFNYVDKPDMDMNTLVRLVREKFGKAGEPFRLPLPIAMALGRLMDGVARAINKPLPVSSIRIRKFASDSVYGTKITTEMFVPPVSLEEALDRTIAHEFSGTKPAAS